MLFRLHESHSTYAHSVYQNSYTITPHMHYLKHKLSSHKKMFYFREGLTYNNKSNQMIIL